MTALNWIYLSVHKIDFRKSDRSKHSPEELKIAEQDMMDQFQMMMDTYHLQQKKLKDRKEWVNTDRTWHGPFKDEPPSEMTVTHINQTKDLYVSHFHEKKLFLLTRYILQSLF
jgi:hypothetical protein